MYQVPHYINGKPALHTHTATRTLYNPATGTPTGNVYFADDVVVRDAVSTAHKAFTEWSATPPLKRARILFKFRDLLENNQKELALLVTREHGKTVDDAKGSVMRAIEVVELHCGLLTQLQGSFSANVASNIDCHTLRQPLGVCAGVSPFNFPVMVPVWMMIPAIACGNTFILKPSEQDPSAPLKLMELLSDAGLPPGVANCINGDKSVVDSLLNHPQIAAITAVASTPVAEYIYTNATANGKRAHTFGGAKNHCLVMPDADIAQTANAIAGAAYGSAGERCMAISVVVAIGEKTADSLLEHLIPLTQNIHIDNGEQANVDMGPMVSKAHRDRVIAAITRGVQEGANLVVDGRNFNHPEYPQGFFLGASLFDGVTENMSIYQEEIFGPVLVLMRAQSFEDALALVNRNQYGNGTAIFTQNGYFAREYSQRVQVGMVGVNVPIPVPVASHPFGGWKRSVFGDLNMHGNESISFYTKLKTITTRWPTQKTEDRHFNMPTH